MLPLPDTRKRRRSDRSPQDRVTPTLIKNYGLLYRAFNRLDCVKMFVIRRETSFLLLNKADQVGFDGDEL